MMAPTFNPSTQEVAGGSLSVQGQLGLLSKFKVSQGYEMRPCLNVNNSSCIGLIDLFKFKYKQLCLSFTQKTAWYKALLSEGSRGKCIVQ